MRDCKTWPQSLGPNLCQSLAPISFTGGEKRHFDMRPYLHFPVFRRLETPSYFALARVDYGTVTWPGEIDIAPETLYAKSIPWVE